MVTDQLQALGNEQAQQVLQSLSRALSEGGITNPTGWILAVLKRARAGKLFAQKTQVPLMQVPMQVPAATDVMPKSASVTQIADKAYVQKMLADIRQNMVKK